MRRWIKVRLKDNEQAYEAADIVEWWKGDRQATVKIVAAVRLYHALEQGNTEALAEHFPYLLEALTGTGGYRRRPPKVPPKIEVIEKSEADDITDLMDSLGF